MYIGLLPVKQHYLGLALPSECPVVTDCLRGVVSTAITSQIVCRPLGCCGGTPPGSITNRLFDSCLSVDLETVLFGHRCLESVKSASTETGQIKFGVKLIEVGPLVAS